MVGIPSERALALDFDIAVALRGFTSEKESIDNAQPGGAKVDAESLTSPTSW